MGSEMCIRDRTQEVAVRAGAAARLDFSREYPCGPGAPLRVALASALHSEDPEDAEIHLHVRRRDAATNTEADVGIAR